MKGVVLLAGPLAAVLALGLPGAGAGQIPLGSASASGQTVTPVFEGWYQNEDGSYTLAFGYYNRNFEEVIEVPLGSGNHLEGPGVQQLQPTHFQPRRHWGVFGVVVPPDFGNAEVVWTLQNQGKTFEIPGGLSTDWEIDALAGEAESGNQPPVLQFSSDGPRGAGPAGVWGERLTAKAGDPLEVSVWATDDGNSRGSVSRPGERAVPVTLTWFKHQGPGDVTFDEGSAEIPVEGGGMTTRATFGLPGEYVLRVRANDASGVARAGHSQCCWTNAFVSVTVTH